MFIYSSIIRLCFKATGLIEDISPQIFDVFFCSSTFMCVTRCTCYNTIFAQFKCKLRPSRLSLYGFGLPIVIASFFT